MQEKTEKLLKNNLVIMITPWIYLLAVLVYDATCFQEYGREGFYYILPDLFLSVLTLFTAFTYKRHEKNVMKALLGAIIGVACANALYVTSYYISYEFVLVDGILSILYSCGYIGLLINHLKLASDHNSNPGAMKRNLVLAVLLILISLGWEIYTGTQTEGYFLYGLSSFLIDASTVILVVAIEARIDFFKLKRQEQAENA